MERAFKAPGNEYRSKPFWAWNGKLDKEELHRQLDILKEMGVGGAFIHSRVGLETEYLGQEWMELVADCLDYGRKIGLELWLYDEDRWPSGTAGGKVTENKENRTKHLQLHIVNAASGIELDEGKTVKGIYSCVLHGHVYRDLKQYQAGCALKDGEKILVLTEENSPCSDAYNGYTYLNTMKGSAVDDFVDSTYQAYRDELPEKSWNEIKGVFTDEPHRGAFLTPFSEGNLLSVPYTDGLESKFRKRFGYSLEPLYPELFFNEEGKSSSKVRRDYLELTQELFLRNYMEKIENWCADKGIKLTGHVLQEDSLSAQTCMIGSVMSAYEYMDVPGIDLLGEKNNCWWIGKQLTSVAHQLGREETLTELYGCTGWQMNFEQYKNIGDWQAMMGISLFCPHLSWYTMKGENKRDYPASIFYQSAWYKEYRYLEDYFARIHVLTRGKAADCRLLVLNPIESVWARSYSGSFEWLDSVDPGISAIESKYRNCFKYLMEAGIDFDYGEERILAGHASVKGNCVVVGNCVYDKVLIAGMETMRESTFSLLKIFSEHGGQLLIAGSKPTMIDTVPDERIDAITQRAGIFALSKEKIIENCQNTKPLVELDNCGQEVFIQSYLTEIGASLIVLNMDSDHAASGIRLKINSKGKLENWNARDGSIRSVDAIQEGDGLYLEFSLEPGEEKLFVLRNDELPDKAGNSCAGDEKPISGFADRLCDSGKQGYGFELSEDNVAVLDLVEISDSSGVIVKKQEFLRADRCLRTGMNIPLRGGEMLQPWYEETYGKDKGKPGKKISVEYSFYVDAVPEKMTLVVERDSSLNAIRLNGKTYEGISEGRRKTEGVWSDPAYLEYEINTSDLAPGENKLVLDVNYGRSSGIEAVYLKGMFGVFLKEGKEVHIGKMPERLKAGNIVPQGLPFYSGRITYHLQDIPKGRMKVSFRELGACVVILHGTTDVEIAFRPYEGTVEDLEAIELVFNRRNSFGPLHLPVSYKGTYGPETFVTKEHLWRNKYQLYPQGLSENIVFQMENGRDKGHITEEQETKGGMK